MTTDVDGEVWTALRTEVTRFGDSCFASNLAIPELGRHGVVAVVAIERVVRSPEFDQARRSEHLVERNLLHLLLVYFEQADECGWDSAGFLGTLDGPVLHDALVAVFQLWGPSRAANRRRVMPRPLYDAWHRLMPTDPDWVGDRSALADAYGAGTLSLV